MSAHDLIEIEFLPEHLIGFDDVEARLNTVDAVREGNVHKRLGPTASFIRNDVVVICGGIHTFWPGMGESWMCVRFSTVGPSVMRAAKEWLDRTIETYKYDRVQAILPVGDKWARTEKYLGFTLECYLPKYGPNGADKTMWSRVKY